MIKVDSEEELKRKANPENYGTFGEWLKSNKWLVILSSFYLIFGLVAALLVLLAKLFGIKYKEMNIFVYYFIIPISWCFLIDYWLNIPLFSCLWCILWAFIIYYNRHGFRAWCVRAFDKSVEFLLWFRTIGWNYYISSVIICVVVPIIVYVGLFYLCFR